MAMSGRSSRDLGDERMQSQRRGLARAIRAVIAPHGARPIEHDVGDAIASAVP